MIKIKVFNEEHEDTLTSIVNDWIYNNSKYEIKDVKFSTSCIVTKYNEQIYCFSALVIYDDGIYKEEKSDKQ